MRHSLHYPFAFQGEDEAQEDDREQALNETSPGDRLFDQPPATADETGFEPGNERDGGAHRPREGQAAAQPDPIHRPHRRQQCAIEDHGEHTSGDA